MKKSSFWCGLVFAVLGIGLILAGLFRDTAFSSLICGMGGGLLGSGAVQLLRYRKWSRPENAEAYRQRLEQEQIDLRDERKAMLRDKSGRYAYILGLVLCAVSIPVLYLLEILGVLEDARLTILFLGAYLVVQYAAGVLFYRRLSDKY